MNLVVGVLTSIQRGMPPDELLVRVRTLVEVVAGDVAHQRRTALTMERYAAEREVERAKAKKKTSRGRRGKRGG
jgi:hypothetical protein